MAKITVIDQQIPNLEQPWAGVYEDGKQWGYDKARVEEFIKKQFGGKFGYIHLRFSDSEKMYYIECYASEEDYKLYESDPETYGKLRLQNERIPITTVKGDAYAATLSTNFNTKANIVVSEKKLIVPVNYRSIKLSEIEGQVNAGYSGTLIIQRSTATGWEEVGRYPAQLVSQDNVNDYVGINLGAYLIDGNQKIRIQAFYEYKTDDGETKQVRSTFLNIGESVTYTQLRLELVTDYSQPMTAINEETGAQKDFKVEYRIFGTCDKVFKYKVYGSVGSYASQQTSLANQNGATVSLSVIENASSYGFLTHGVRKVEAWVEANDGLGGVIKSEVYTNHFMMVNENSEGYDATKKYLLVQNLKTEVTNYIQTTIADYAVYAPDESDTDIHFQLTDAKGKTYTDMNRTVSANTQSSLVATIEIEAEDENSIPDNYITRLYAFRDGVNFITDSGYIDTNHVSIDYFDIVVDNKNAITPITGATFKLDPKNRSNDESDHLAIYGPGGENIAEWTNPDRINAMWTTDANGIKVLRIMAGSRLVIKRNVWKQFLTNPNSAMTFNLDFRVSNVTNTTDPIVSISGGTGGRGLVLNALQGWVKTATYSNPDNCMFAWREDVRQYLSLNIDNAVQPRKQNVPDVKYEPSRETDSVKTISLARILLNGDPVREIPFDSSSSSEWCDDPNAAIIIGNDGADIDIYSLTTYENRKLNLVDLLNRNYLSSIATTEEKMRIKQRNAIFDGERITLAAAEEAGFNCIIYHGKRPYYGNSSKQKTGWIEYRRYDQNGTYLPEYSGTNCKESNALGWKPQGTTAQTYWEFNQQDDNSKVETMINVKVEDFHESIHVRIEGDKAYIYGGNLGKNFPLEETEEEYAYANGYVSVPDGWIDGNGKYRGMGYQVAPDTPLAQKKVAKINFASAMQSHLIGACNTYDLLHYAVCGATPLQKQYEDAGLQRPVMSKHTEPFLMFWDESEDGNGTPYYTGLCVYGAGKMDKVSWGYVKSEHENFCMIEGADNNRPLTDFRVPFDKNIPYSSDGEGFKYGVKNEDGSVDYFQAFDFDAGKTTSFDSPQYDDGWPIVDPIEEEQEDGSKKLVYEAPSKAVRDRFADIHNFIYLNSTNIKHFDGTEAQFLASDVAKNDRTYKYWCTIPFHSDESTPLRLLRFDYLAGEWTDAGLLGSDGKYTMVDLKKDPRTASTWAANRTKSNYAEISAAFANDMAKFMKEHIEFFISAQSLRLCYQYVLAFLAGTDNSSKNTYYQIDPIPQKMQRNETFASWFSTSFGHDFDFENVYRMYMSGDDMDSILPVNNMGNLTKPYYIERLFPYADDKPAECLYEGMGNQLFNFVEKAYTDEDRATLMKTILTRASSLVSENDNLLALKDKKISTWGFLHKYFFNIQYYFPQIAYIEQARIRYEFAQLMGASGARGVRPISQSIGSQVENEQQFMAQRVVYFASFASFGEFGLKSENTSTGLGDAEARISFQAAPLPNGDPATITFTIIPHQYMYPCGFYTEANVRTPRQRTSPKQTCTVNIVSGYNGGDDTMGLLGVNYYTDLGDLKTLRVDGGEFIISGKRLTKVTSSWVSTPLFRPASLVLNCINLKLMTLNIDRDLNQLDMSALVRLKSITLAGWIYNPIFPKSSVLESITMNGFRTLRVEELPNLKTFSFSYSGSGYYLGQVGSIYIGNNVGGIKTDELCQGLYTGQSTLSKPTLQSIHIENIDWTDFPIETLEWYMNRPTCEFKGKIAIKETDNVRFETKRKMLREFGEVDSEANPLYVTYSQRALTDFNLKGDTQTREVGEYLYEAIPDTVYANAFKRVDWSLIPNTTRATIDDDGVLTIDELYTEAEGTAVDVKCAITKLDGTMLEDTLHVRLFRRAPKVGDKLFTDASFDDTIDSQKTFCGVCFYVEDMGDYYDARFVANENLSTGVANPWGLYDNADNGITGVKLTDDESYDCYDTPVQNITSYGMPSAASDMITSDKYCETIDGDVDYKLFASTEAAGYGVKNTAGAGTNAAGNYANYIGVDATEQIPQGHIDTVKIILHRNKLLEDSSMGIVPPTASGTLTEMDDLKAKVKALTDARGSVYAQFFYPSSSLCYAYQPSGTVADELKVHKWYNPSVGEMVRLCYLCYHLYPDSVDTTDGIFAEDIAAGRFTRMTASYFQSSSEYSRTYYWLVGFGSRYFLNFNKYYSYAVRPVVALKIKK